MKHEQAFHCDNKLKAFLLKNIRSFQKIKGDDGGLTRAAVTLTVVDIGKSSGSRSFSSRRAGRDEAALVLTQRAFGLRKHSGQWALPGGRMDAGETPEEAALRELEEEVGVVLKNEHVLGRLDDFKTRSGYAITPVVVWGGKDISFDPNPEEVSSVHRIPLNEFLRSDAPVLEGSSESKHPVLYMPVGNHLIAAPTAAILYQFREVALLGKHTRVAHYEQPFFAWN